MRSRTQAGVAMTSLGIYDARSRTLKRRSTQFAILCLRQYVARTRSQGDIPVIIKPQVAERNISANPPMVSNKLPGQKDERAKTKARDWLRMNNLVNT
jgi:hypothetical protein